MAKQIVSFIAGLAAMLICVGLALGQESETPRKPMPSMSNDDLASRRAPAVESTEIVLKPPKPAPAGFPAGWATYSPEECGFTIVSPGQMVAVELPVPASIASIVLSQRYYSYHDEHKAFFAFHLVSAVPLPLRQLTDAVFQDEANLRDLKYSIGAPKDPKGSRLPVSANYSENSQPYSIEGFAQGLGKHTWLILGFYERDNAQAAEAVRKALGSARFDGKPCRDH